MGGRLRNGNKAHKLTREDSSKGGKTWTIVKAVSRRKICSLKCPFYEKCPLMPASIKKKDSKGKHACLLKKGPKKIQNRIFNLFVKGEDGIIEELRRILFDIGIDAEESGSAKIRLAFFDKAKDFLESVYGKKIKQEITADVTSKGYSAEDFYRTAQKLYGKKPEKKANK